GARHTKARSRHQGESRLELQALYAGSHLCGEGAGWIWSRTTSSMTCRVRRQKSVSVEAKQPFSESLLTGAPPPQKRKYAQVRRHCSTPSAMSPRSAAKRCEAMMESSEWVRTLPSVKSPYRS